MGVGFVHPRKEDFRLREGMEEREEEVREALRAVWFTKSVQTGSIKSSATFVSSFPHHHQLVGEHHGSHSGNTDLYSTTASTDKRKPARP